MHYHYHVREGHQKTHKYTRTLPSRNLLLFLLSLASSLISLSLPSYLYLSFNHSIQNSVRTPSPSSAEKGQPNRSLTLSRMAKIRPKTAVMNNMMKISRERERKVLEEAYGYSMDKDEVHDALNKVRLGKVHSAEKCVVIE